MANNLLDGQARDVPDFEFSCGADFAVAQHDSLLFLAVSHVQADVVFSDAILHRADAVIGSDCDPRGDGDERCPIHSIEIREDDEFPFVYIEGISRVFV